MAIDPNSLMLRLNPMRPLSLAPLQQAIGGADRSLERERLRLMREQFEESRRQHREQEALSKLEEAGRTTRAKMQAEAEAEALRQKQRAELMQRRQEGIAKFGELNASGDIEGARAMVPFLDSLGVGVSLEGEEAGLPRYRIDTDPEATAKAELDARNAAGAAGDELGAAGIGYPTDDSGVLDEPGISSSDQVGGGPNDLTVAERVASTYGEPGNKTPMAQAPAPDYTGGVPKNVIDMGAIQAQTLARLDPALGGLINAYPEPYRESAAQTAAATRGLGLPANKAMETFDKLRGGPDSLLQAQIAAYAQQDKFRETRDELTPIQRNTLVKTGFQEADKTFKSSEADKYLGSLSAADEVIELLTNKDSLDDVQVANKIVQMSGGKGTQSDKDVNRALGLEAGTLLDQAAAIFHTKVTTGGFDTKQRNSLIGYAKQAQKRAKGNVFKWMENVDSTVSTPDTDENVAVGWKRYRDGVIPRHLRDEYRSSKEKKTAPGDATSGASPIPETARIARVHNNPGNLKFADQQGAEKGEAASDGGSWAKFKTYEDGLAALRKQIEKDAGRGLTVRQFVSKYAPPKSNDTEKYVDDAVAALGVSEDAKMSDIDIDDAVAFVAKKESGTDVGVADSTDDDAEARALQILERGGY